jgi:hypothetical protein
LEYSVEKGGDLIYQQVVCLHALNAITQSPAELLASSSRVGQSLALTDRAFPPVPQIASAFSARTYQKVATLGLSSNL